MTVSRVDRLEPETSAELASGTVCLVVVVGLSCCAQRPPALMYVLLAQKVAEISSRVGGVANQESLGLGAVVLVAVYVRQGSRNLSVCKRRSHMSATHTLGTPVHHPSLCSDRSVSNQSQRLYAPEAIQTSILIGNNLGLVVDRKRNRTVGVAKGNTDDDPVRRLGTGPHAVALRHAERL